MEIGSFDRRHLRDLSRIERLIGRIFDSAASEAARLGASVSSPLRNDRIFSFSDYPQTRRAAERLLRELRDSLRTAVVDGVRASWELSAEKNDELCRSLLGGRLDSLPAELASRWFDRNEEALSAFMERKSGSGGLNLSERVWRYAEEFRDEIEMGLDCGIRGGESAEVMARELKQYLRHPDKLFRRVRDERGILHLSKRARNFHPGQGVYRSSFKNARRMAATETNMAYRTADHLRWQRLDFVVGIEVRLSNNHTCLGSDGKAHPLTDVCDALKGRYPKDFKFTGWHPQCRCHAVPVLKTEDEMEADASRIMSGEEPLPSSASSQSVEAPPSGWTDWVKENEEGIAKARARGTAPWFLRDNGRFVDEALEEEEYLRKGKGNKRSKSKFDDEDFDYERYLAENASKETTEEPTLEKTLRFLEGTGIEQIPPRKLSEELTVEQIIEKVGGVDETSGSCTSLALAYAGNRLGYDVEDFRGGKSAFVFQRPDFLDMFFMEAGGTVVKQINTLSAATGLLNKIEEGKEYLFGSPRHTAVVRRYRNRIQYLNLQENVRSSGYIQLSIDHLRNVFGCEEVSRFNKPNRVPTCAIVGLDELRNCSKFIYVMKYFNTKL